MPSVTLKFSRGGFRNFPPGVDYFDGRWGQGVPEQGIAAAVAPLALLVRGRGKNALLVKLFFRRNWYHWMFKSTFLWSTYHETFEFGEVYPNQTTLETLLVPESVVSTHLCRYWPTEIWRVLTSFFSI